MQRVLFVLALWWGLGGTAWSQNYYTLECPDLRYFDDECTRPLPAPTAPAPPPQMPLFSRETMARDTPAPLVDLLNDPTDERLAQYVLYEEARHVRRMQVQEMLRQYHVRKGR